MVEDLLDALADLALGGCCAGCGRPGRAACRDCVELLSGPGRPAWPDPVPPGLPPPFAVGAYEGPVRDLLLAHKEHARYGLARPLGAALAGSVSAAVGSRRPEGVALALVPPPSAPAVVRTRGHDPVLRMARRAAVVLRAAGLACTVRPVLHRSRRVSDQAGLGAAARAANLHGAYVVPAQYAWRLLGAPALVVDDVITTGATAAEAARALRAAGTEVVAAAVVAATRRRVAPGSVCGGAGAGR